MLVGNPDVQLAVEAAETPQCRVDYVRPVSSRDDDHVGRGLDAVHEGQQLRHDPLLRLSPGLPARLAIYGALRAGRVLRLTIINFARAIETGNMLHCQPVKLSWTRSLNKKETTEENLRECQKERSGSFLGATF